MLPSSLTGTSYFDNNSRPAAWIADLKPLGGDTMHRKLALAFTAALILAVAPGAFAWQVTCNSYKSVAGADYARTAPYMSFKFCNTSTGACYWGNTGGFASGVFDAPEG